MSKKGLQINRLWSNNPSIDIGDIEHPIDPIAPNWSNNCNLSFDFIWSNNADFDFVRRNPVPPSNIWDNSANLKLVVEWSNNADLVFSPVLDPVEPPVSIVEAVGKCSLHDPLVSSRQVVIHEAIAFCDLVAPLSPANSEIDINVYRGISLITESKNSNGTNVDCANESLFSDSPKQHNSKVVSIFDGAYLTDSIVAPQLSFDRAHNENVVTIFDCDYISNSVEHKQIGLIDANLGVYSLFADGDLASRDIASLYKYPPRADCKKSALWLDAEKNHREWLSKFLSGLPIKLEWFSYYEDAIDPTGTRPVDPIEPPLPIPERLADLDIKVLWSNLADLEFVRIELDALIIMNTVIMYHTSKLGERTYINPVSWAVSNDLDSFAWTLNCSLYDNGILDLIATDDTFTLEVNDVKWNFNAFKYKRLQDGQFSGYSVTFVSQTQQLGYPLAQPVNVSLDAPKGAIQLIDETLGDIPLINKGVNEWTLQADTIEMMQAEPKAIISEILKASGAVMLPSVSGESIMIQPRYKVASWLMNELTDEECDVLLDGNYMVTDSGEIRNGVEYNAVTISGEKSGVVTKIVRDGTGGETEATDYTTQFHQDHNVGLEYAKKVFSESGTIELAEISVGLDENLLQSGSIVRIKHASGDRTGVSLGVSVKGDRVENVLQTATIEFRI